MILVKNLTSLVFNFGPIPLGWRVRSLNFDVAPTDPTLASVLTVRAGFLSSILTNSLPGTLTERSNRMITGKATVGDGVTLINYVGSMTHYPAWRFILPASTPIDVDWEIYLGVELAGFVNVTGSVSVDLIPLTPVELARAGRAVRNYLLDDLLGSS